MRALLFEFIVGEAGQDLIEYALLCVFIGLVAVATFNTMSLGIRGAYTSWDSGQQGLWIPLDPQ